MAARQTAEYKPTLPNHTTETDARLQVERDGTLRAGLRPRGYGTTAGAYRGGILITTAGTITFTGEDAVQVATVPVVVGMTIPGPITVDAVAGGCTFLGYK